MNTICLYQDKYGMIHFEDTIYHMFVSLIHTLIHTLRCYEPKMLPRGQGPRARAKDEGPRDHGQKKGNRGARARGNL